jgi:hypothetical protein
LRIPPFASSTHTVCLRSPRSSPMVLDDDDVFMTAASVTLRSSRDPRCLLIYSCWAYFVRFLVIARAIARSNSAGSSSSVPFQMILWGLGFLISDCIFAFNSAAPSGVCGSPIPSRPQSTEAGVEQDNKQTATPTVIPRTTDRIHLLSCRFLLIFCRTSMWRHRRY